jgi:hypothetical protein
MSSVADFQARARARALRATPDTPEFTMNDPPNPQENERNDGTEEATEIDTSMAQNEDATRNEFTRSHNTIRRDGFTVDDVTRFIHRHNLPEGVVSDVQNFQRVFPLSSFVCR